MKSKIDPDQPIHCSGNSGAPYDNYHKTNEFKQGISIVYESGNIISYTGGGGDTTIGNLSLNSLISFLSQANSQYQTIYVKENGDILLKKSK